MWAKFESNLDLLLRECAIRTEKETQIQHSQKSMKMHIVQQTKHQLQRNISRKLFFKYKELDRTSQ